MRHTTIIACLASLALCHGASSHGQTGTATTTVRAAPSAPSVDEIPMADYLGLLAQISPAARDGAQAYLLAFQQRCGRALTTMELRQAIAQGEGDPVLMAMVRASHPSHPSQQAQRDTTLRQLSQSIRCDGGHRP